MNPIAIWCKFKDYGDWCYAYRIPEESEFVEGFEFEYINFIGNYPKKDIIKPYLTIDFDIIPFSWEKRIVTKRVDYEVIWSIIPVMYGRPYNLPLNHLKSYLEAGYIRVKKADERKTKCKNKMKFYYCYLNGVTLESNPLYAEGTLFAKSINMGVHKSHPISKIVILKKEEDTPEKALLYLQTKLLKHNLYKDVNFPSTTTTYLGEILEINGSYYRRSHNELLLYTEKESNPFIHTNSKDQIFVLSDNSEDEKIFWEYVYSNNLVNKDIPDKIEDSALYKKQHPTENKKELKPNLKAFSNLTTKLMNVCKTIKQTIVKIEPDERYLGKEQGWKPIVKPTCHQPEKSPNALVCIATKDRKEFKRVSRKDASEIMSTQLADEKEWEYISKQEYRKLLEPLTGRSFTPRLGEIGYTPQEKFSPNKSSSKVAICKRKSKHHQQGVKKPKNYNNYEVSFHKDYKDGQAEFVYAVTAKTEEKALSRAKKKLHAESPEAEYHRKHGMANLPLFKPVVKLLSEGSTNSPLRGESVYKRIILPKVIDLPIRKDKKGNIIPWTKKVTRLTTEEERAKGKAMFEIVDEEIKTYTKYEVSYHKQSSPFKKTKKWKHPIKDNRKIIKK